MSSSDICERRAGFISLIGAPNVGKSTLMNRIVGQKVTIVTPKVQTTRSLVRGIVMKEATQLIFVDTPGIFAPKHRLGRAMVTAAWQAARDSDVILLLSDCARKQIDQQTVSIIDHLQHQNQKASLILNKIDLLHPHKYLTRIEEMAALYPFEKIFLISAQTGSGIDDLCRWLVSKMPPGPYLFDPDDLSDMPSRLLAAEILREKIFLNLHQELPYTMTVTTESWVEKPDGSIDIRMLIFVSKHRHKAIILGKQGQTLRRIGQSARLELESLLGQPVHLFNHVTFKKDWMDDKTHYAPWALDFHA